VIPEEALEFNASTTDPSAVFVEMPANREWTAATGSFKAMVAANQEAAPAESGELEIDAATLASILTGQAPASGQRAPTPDSPEPTPSTEGQAEAGADASQAERAGGARRAPARHATPHPRPAFEAATTRAPEAPGDEETAAAEPDELGLSALLDELPNVIAEPSAFPARLPPQLWWIGAALAALSLIIQIVNHYRDDLAASARFRQPLTALYAAIGVPLAPHWDLHAYDVHQLGATAQHGPAGRITVRASIKNAAQQAQPLPLLRVTLEDRFGNRIAARDVAPSYYLPRTIPPSSFLSAGQRIDAEMGFVDPGANAVGFEIDACLPASGGGIACANDSGAAR